MFNKILFPVKKLSLIIVIFTFFYSCKNEVTPVEFSETAIENQEHVNIEIIYPKVTSKSGIASKINSEIEQTISKNIAFFEDDTEQLSLEASIKDFENRYINFKKEFQDSSIKWDVNVSGEVVYNSENVITIAIDSYTFTGGAHGNSVITLLNFNPKTGALYSFDDIFNNPTKVAELAETYLEKELNISKNQNTDDYFFDEFFKMPENIGFSDEGIIFLYNTYEIAAYAQGVTEFTIPYSDISEFLKLSE